MLSNRRTMIFTLIFPAALFFAFGTSTDTAERVGSGNVSAYVMVSMGLYGAALTAATAGAMVAIERSLGWSRQLRLTPLNPVAHILIKALVALSLGAIAIVVVNLAGLAQGKPDMPASTWVASAVVTLLCTLTFAALGVFVGYVVPGENTMQLLGPGLVLLSFLGGLFIPLTTGSAIWHVAVFTPMYGVAEVARAPLTHELPWYALVNAVVWFVIFVAGAAWRMSKDTSRV
jgi:ABC-2 type transport system permease protein